MSIHKLPRTKGEVLLEIISIIFVFVSITKLILVWNHLPEQIPMHFNFKGEVDGWGGKSSLIFLLCFNLFNYLFMTIIAFFPRLYNYPWKITEANAKIQYQLARTLIVLLKTEIVIFFTYIEFKSIQIALGKDLGLSAAAGIIFLLIIFGTMGVYFYKAYKNK